MALAPRRGLPRSDDPHPLRHIDLNMDLATKLAYLFILKHWWLTHVHGRYLGEV